jgi:diadenosine tetraphosphatase ApaH/serine/threonine PP2A family protein phosphatase
MTAESAESPGIESSVPRRGRLFAVGDIHGCIEELTALLREIDPAPGDKVVFLGDYVDRGPDPRAVVDLLIDFRDSRRCETVFLRGNHEDMFLAYLGERGSHGDAFVFNGGQITLASYGVRRRQRGVEARGRIPESHIEFFRGLTLSELDPPLLFVHAGISPLRTLAEQDEEDLLWIRDEFVRNRHVLKETVVFGHTPMRDVLWHVPFKIGLDTGCVYGNKLSCLEFTTATLVQVERASRRVTQRNVAAELGPLAGLKDHARGV